MSEQRNDGGPAFPYEHKEWDYDHCSWRTHYIHPGMTLRDYFAAKALQGLIASNDEGAGDRIGDLPQYAYLIADAMLKARDA